MPSSRKINAERRAQMKKEIQVSILRNSINLIMREGDDSHLFLVFVVQKHISILIPLLFLFAFVLMRINT